MPLRASNAELWFNCPASLMMEVGKPDETDETNEVTYQGLCAHYLAASILSTNSDFVPDSLIGKILYVVKVDDALDETVCWADNYSEDVGTVVYEYTVDHDMVRAVNVYLGRIAVINPRKDDHLIRFIEQSFAFDFMTGGKGDVCTPDLLVYDRQYKIVYIHDLKYGRGEVAAKENKQLLCYAAAFRTHWEKTHHDVPNQYNFYIHQPNLGLTPGWQCDDKTIVDFVSRAQDSSDLARLSLLHPNSEAAIKLIKPGVHCQQGHCKARASCTKLADYITNEVDAETLPMSHSEFTKGLTPERLKWLYERRKLFHGWADQIEQTVVDGFKKGETPIPGHKLVNKDKGTRIYRNAEETEAELKRMRIPLDTAFPRKMLSAPQLMDACDRGEIGSRNAKKLRDNYVIRTPSRQVVVPADDERPAVNPTADDFEEISPTEVNNVKESPVTPWFDDIDPSTHIEEDPPEVKDTNTESQDPFNFL